jgi:hypothetical protein
VANLRNYTDQMTHLPAYLTAPAEVDGFCKFAQILVEVKTHF